MLKPRLLAIALLPIAPALLPMQALSVPQPQTIAQSLGYGDDGDLFCFMRTSNGQVVNLTRLCQTSRSVSQPGASQAAQPSAQPMQQSSSQFDTSSPQSSAVPSALLGPPLGNVGVAAGPNRRCALFDTNGNLCPGVAQ